MCRLALKTASDPFSPYEVLTAMEAMQEGYDGSGLGLLLRGLQFDDFKYNSKEDLVQIPEVYALIQQDVKDFNKNIAKTEHILKFRLVADEWTSTSGELSPTLKLKRKFIAEKYRNQIEQIYAKQMV